MINYTKLDSKNIIKCIFVATCMVFFSGCMLIPITEKDLIGTYKGTLPDGGIEIFTLKPQGKCDQLITLKDGRKFATTGTWKPYLPYNVELRWLFVSMNYMGKVNPDIGKQKDTGISLPVWRGFSGVIILGADEGIMYFKKKS